MPVLFTGTATGTATGTVCRYCLPAAGTATGTVYLLPVLFTCYRYCLPVLPELLPVLFAGTAAGTVYLYIVVSNYSLRAEVR